MAVSIIRSTTISDDALRARQDLYKQPLNQRPIQDVSFILDTCDAMRTPLDLLLDNLFSADLNIQMADERFEVAPQFRSVFKSHWTVFAVAVVKSLVCFGFAVADVDEKGLPFVRDPGDLDIELIHSRDGRPVYRVKHKQRFTGLTVPDLQNPPLDLTVFETDCPRGGCITSLVACFRSAFWEVTEMLAIQKRGMANAANPAYITEDNGAVGTATTAELARDRSRFGDVSSHLNSQVAAVNAALVQDGIANARQNAVVNVVPQRSAFAAEGSVSSLRLADSNGEAQHVDDPELWRMNDGDNLMRVKLPQGSTYTNPRISLEKGRRLVLGPTPIVSMDLKGAKGYLEAVAGNLTRVPRGIWGGQMDASIATNETILNTLYTTVQRWNKIVVAVVEHMLQVATFWMREDSVARYYDESLSPEENYAMGDMRVTLPFPKDAAGLQQILESGWLKPEVQASYIASVHGIPADHVAPNMLEPASGVAMRDVVADDREIERESKRLDSVMKAVQIAQAMQQPPQQPASSASSSSSAPREIKTLSISDMGKKLRTALQGALSMSRKLLPTLSPDSRKSLDRSSRVRVAVNPKKKRADPKKTK